MKRDPWRDQWHQMQIDMAQWEIAAEKKRERRDIIRNFLLTAIAIILAFIAGRLTR